MRYLAITFLLVGFLSLGCNKPNPAPAPTSPTNTGVNARDKDAPPGKEPVTGQDETSADVETSGRIRRIVTAAYGTTSNAGNVKIMTSKGQVLLRGPVDTVTEKDRIIAIAKEVAGAANVTSEITVVNAPAVPARTPPTDNPPPVDPKDAPKVLPPVTPPVVPPTNPPAPGPAPGTEPAVKPETKS